MEYICDRCQKRVNDADDLDNFWIFTHQYGLSLCKTCMVKLVKLIKDWMKNG